MKIMEKNHEKMNSPKRDRPTKEGTWWDEQSMPQLSFTAGGGTTTGDSRSLLGDDLERERTKNTKIAENPLEIMKDR